LKKATMVIILSTIIIVSFTCMHAFCADAATDAYGPAPSSGDGISEGSGYNRNDWPNEDSPGVGPAPSSGDGDPDGSGF